MINRKNLIVGLDIGTSKVVALVGNLTHNDRIEVIGMGVHPSRGLKKGVVVNIEATVQSIQEAVAAAEAMAGCQVHSAYTGIAGSHISSINSYGAVPIRNSEVNEDDIARVIDSAKAFPIPADHKILHILPQEFIIDNQYGIRDPIGMSGVRLEAKVHMIVGSTSAAQNIATCIQRCGLEMGGIILEQVASSQSVLHDDERESGVCLVDIGAGTTDLAVFVRDAIMYTRAIPMAGDQVTNDIAITLHVPLQLAEDLKVNYATVRSGAVNSSDMIMVSPSEDRQGRKLSRKLLANVVEARYTELFELIKQQLEYTGLNKRLACGVVLTGGASKIPDIVELAESVLQMPVRMGTPKQRVDGIEDVLADPMYATGIGLLLYGKKQWLEHGIEKRILGNGMKGAWQRITGWFKGNF